MTRLRPTRACTAGRRANADRAGPGGRPRWGRHLPPPRQGGRWPGAWQRRARSFLYGRLRAVRWKEVLCLWRVLGHDVVVKAVVATVEGYRSASPLVSSATDLSGLQVVELFCAASARKTASAT